jgi:type III restriction enzyme
VLEGQSVAEQANAIRASLSGLSTDDQQLLAQAPVFNGANNTFGSWQAGAAVIAQRTKEFRTAVQSVAVALQPSPSEPAPFAETLVAARADFNAALEQILTALDQAVTKVETISDPAVRRGENPWSEWERQYLAFQTRYAEAVQRSSSHTEKLNQLSALETKIADVARAEAKTREQLNALAGAEQAYAAARGEWLAARKAWDDLVDAECASLTARSGGVIRVSVRRFADTAPFVELLKQSLSGSRIQGAKLEAIGATITAAANPEALWLDVLEDLEALAAFDRENSPNENRPNAPTLISNGLSVSDIDKIAATLKPEDWLNLSLTSVGSRPIYEFRARDQEYIPFQNASAGQQATALLKTLLNQPGPPLIIDQPEEDLDNPVMIEIVGQIWKAKQLRQIIFASHNANLVVNGDAELVAWFGYRVAGDQSRGMIEGQGAIDIPATREAIKRIMEGGENAFRLRREKYGF